MSRLFLSGRVGRRRAHDLDGRLMRLLTLSNPKTVKGESLGWLTGILHLAPARIARVRGFNACPDHTPGCVSKCLFHQGRGRMPQVSEARIRRTRLWKADPDLFLTDLHSDLEALVRLAQRRGMKAACRLNGTSDIPWEREAPEVFSHPVRFYDYTKSRARAETVNPAQYDLTYSWSEKGALSLVGDPFQRVAVVFRGELPETWHGVPVIDGDEHDLRFLEPRGVVIGLSPKGTAKKDRRGFVVDTDQKGNR